MQNKFMFFTATLFLTVPVAAADDDAPIIGSLDADPTMMVSTECRQTGTQIHTGLPSRRTDLLETACWVQGTFWLPTSATVPLLAALQGHGKHDCTRGR